MRAVQIDRPGGELRLVDLDLTAPGSGQVRVRVEACGVCHTDYNITSGGFGDTAFPLTPGHEIAGRVDALGQGVEGFAVGDRVAIGWFGGNCNHCPQCRAGDFINCANRRYPGLSYRGGYAESITVPESALARIPGQLGPVAAAPLTCAGSTVFNGLRSAGAQPGDLVAVLGIGGLGHLAVQFAAKMGFETVAIARGQEKKAFAAELGAHHYVDSTSQDVAQALQELGGARVVLATVTQAAAMSQTIDGLCPHGTLVVAGASPDNLDVSPGQLIRGEKSIRGAAAGTASDIEATMRFAAVSGISAMTEEADLSDAAAAFARMLSGNARFRMVLTAGA